jgi:hypothetical protein
MWVDHKGVTRFLSTGYDVRRNEWDAVSGTLIVRGASLGRRRRLNRYAKDMARDMNRIETIVKTLEGARKNFTADEITQKVMNNP